MASKAIRFISHRSTLLRCNNFILAVEHEFFDSQPYIDVYTRETGAHIDETNVIYNLFEYIKGDQSSIMGLPIKDVINYINEYKKK